jgi:FtsH-binding integral membrane protein
MELTNKNNVFERTDTSDAIVSPAVYNLVIGLTLCWGFAVNWLIVTNIDPRSIAAINPWMFFIGYFASCFFGMYLFNSSTNPAVSFIGYNFVVVPFGLIVNLIVSNYDASLVSDAIRVTGLVTIAMMCFGSLFPAFFQRIAGALTVALLIVIIVELVEVFLFRIHHGIIDWAIVLIFCGYIGYDWGRANRIPKTVDNAIDSAAALYMDIINLFIRILRIMSRR